MIKKSCLILVLQFYWRFMQFYARRDGFDSGGIQDEMLDLNAKEEVIFRRKLQFEKKQTNTAP